jgi:hypothetical protein
MKSHTTERFRKAFQQLPTEVQEAARKAYSLWKQNPQHRSLQFKQIHRQRPIYSVRVGRAWRAVGIRHEEYMLWFWIGSHGDYDKLIAQL